METYVQTARIYDVGATLKKLSMQAQENSL